MKTFLLIVAAVLAITPSLSAQDEEKYSRRYDNIDVNTIFRSSRLLNNYVDCLLDKKPCPPEGKDLKRVLPDALKTRCGACTEVQKAKALDVITRLYYDHPKMYLALVARYDPTGEYTRNFENWYDDQNTVKSRPPGKEERIPSTWITSSTRTTTTTQRSTTRISLRTQPASVRTAPPRVQPTERAREEPVTFRAPPPSPLTSVERQSTTTVFPEPPAPVTVSTTFRPLTPRQPPTTPKQTNPPVFREPPTTLRAFQAPITEAPTTRFVPITEPPTTTQQTVPSTTVFFTPPLTRATQPPQVFRQPAVIFEAPFQPNFEPPPFQSNFEAPEQPPQTFQAPTVQTFIRPNSIPVQRVDSTFGTFPATVKVQTTTLTQFPTVRDQPITFREPDRFQPAPAPRRPVQNFQPNSLIDNFFIPNGNGPIRRSINRFIDTTGKVVNNVAGMFRSTVGALTGNL